MAPWAAHAAIGANAAGKLAGRGAARTSQARPLEGRHVKGNMQGKQPCARAGRPGARAMARVFPIRPWR